MRRREKRLRKSLKPEDFMTVSSGPVSIGANINLFEQSLREHGLNDASIWRAIVSKFGESVAKLWNEGADI